MENFSKTFENYHVKIFNGTNSARRCKTEIENLNYVNSRIEGITPKVIEVINSKTIIMTKIPDSYINFFKLSETLDRIAIIGIHLLDRLLESIGFTHPDPNPRHIRIDITGKPFTLDLEDIIYYDMHYKRCSTFKEFFLLYHGHEMDLSLSEKEMSYMMELFKSYKVS